MNAIDWITGFLVGLGVLIAIAWVVYPPLTREQIAAGNDRILGVTQDRPGDPCPACMAPLDLHTSAEYQRCAKEFFR